VVTEQNALSEAMHAREELFEAVGHKLQTFTSVGTEVFTAWAQRAAENARERQAAIEAQERLDSQRLAAQKKAAMPLMQRVWNERWWSSRPTPEQIGQSWETIAGWAANGDAYAQQALQQMVTELKERYALSAEQIQTLGDAARIHVPGRDVALMLAARAAPGAEASGIDDEPGLAPAERSYSFAIRDLQSGEIVLHQTQAWAYLDARPLELVATDTLAGFLVDRDDLRTPDSVEQIDRYTLTIAEGSHQASELDGRAGQFYLTDREVQAVQADYDQWSADVRAGRIEATPEQARDAFLVERARLRDQLDRLAPDPRIQAARDYLVEEIRGRGRGDERVPERAEGDRPTERMSAEERAARSATLRDALAETDLGIEMATARVHGEDPELVIAARHLRGSLDEDWWLSASAEEIAGLYAHVGRWSEGNAKATVRRDLRAGIFQHHGIEVGQNATHSEVSKAIHRAQAEASGQKLIEFEISAPGSSAKSQGLTVVDKDLPLEEIARRQLASFAGGREAARGLTIRLMGQEGKPIAHLDADGQHVNTRAEHPSTGTPEDPSAHTDRPVGARVASIGATNSGPMSGPDGHGVDDHEALERLRGVDPETAQASLSALRGLPQSMRQRLNAYRHRRARLGPTEGPRTQWTLQQHRGPER
jgi:hypothetical protein